MANLIEVTGRVKALMAEHKDTRDGIWVRFDADGDSTDRWYIDFLDESALAVSCELQLLRDALLHNLETRLWYEDDPTYSPHRVIHQVRIDAA